ncbi:hypothetical protein M8J76_016757 [Diaphorina citri]|nr:hypothetical protein M8J75_011511 [Diaphorina citri]KAI5733851.1 hypothetical protein M8J76_016757 [Diaphorina citri]
MVTHRGMQVMYKLLSGVLLCRMMSASSQVAKNKITLKIENILTKKLNPSHIDVINESFSHTGISPSEEPELASHFKIVVVSSQFENKPFIACHRLVQGALQDAGIYDIVHAIQIVTKTPEDWEKSKVVPDAPKCMGGDGRQKAKA